MLLKERSGYRFLLHKERCFVYSDTKEKVTAFRSKETGMPRSIKGSGESNLTTTGLLGVHYTAVCAKMIVPAINTEKSLWFTRV